MARYLVTPVEIPWLTRLLFRLKADCRGPLWLRRKVVGDHPDTDLFSQVARSICREPDDWQANDYGLTNFKRQVGLFAAYGAERLVVAADGDKQFYPPPFWRWFLHQLFLNHRDYSAGKVSDQIEARFLNE